MHPKPCWIAPFTLFLLAALPLHAQNATPQYEMNDDHLHLTNYVQKGIDMHQLVQLMGDRVGRTAVFGIPLQQQWSFRNDGDRAPDYYLATDSPLYYYSFTDAYIAMQYRSLSKQEQQRLDPMITGFDPADMYAADHIRRVLQTFPGVFSGIGEFTIHKEFVSGKISGEVASLQDPALDRILDLAGEVGLVVILHNDLDTPFSKAGKPPAYLEQMKALLRRHPKTTIIWAHTGMGRIVRPVQGHAGIIESLLKDPAFDHVYFDVSWNEVAKYFVSSPEATKIAAALINGHPDRFIFGTDEVAPPDQRQYLRIYDQYATLFTLLTPETKRKLLKSNYERLFDRARTSVRAWEKANPH